MGFYPSLILFFSFINITGPSFKRCSFVRDNGAIYRVCEEVVGKDFIFGLIFNNDLISIALRKYRCLKCVAYCTL